VTGPTDGLAVATDPAELGFDSVRLGRIDNLLRRYVEDGKLPGWSVLVSRRGQPVYLARGGLRDIEAGTGVELDTIFRIYSMTKPVTSVAAMMLYERGALELTDPIARWLPEFADMRVWDGGSDLKPKTVPALEPIRVWHLLTHTSGLTYGFHRAHPVDALYRAAGYEWGAPPSVDLAAATKAFASMPLLFHPGREWNYSVATDVLGRLVEVLSGQLLDAFFQEHIFAARHEGHRLRGRRPGPHRRAVHAGVDAQRRAGRQRAEPELAFRRRGPDLDGGRLLPLRGDAARLGALRRRAAARGPHRALHGEQSSAGRR
jgi:CubicO group peptidase (beta-lactamase class C family)